MTANRCGARLVYGEVGSDNLDCECELPRGHEPPHESFSEGLAGGSLSEDGHFVIRWPVTPPEDRNG